MKNRLVIRADGNSNIGYGHVIRSLSVASMLKDRFELVFASHSPNKFLREQICKICDQLVVLDDPFSEIFFEITKKNDVVIIDNYYFDLEYQKRIKKIGCSLVCIDDLHDRRYFADVIINHAPGVTYECYSTLSFTKFALGPQYAMLRPEFMNETHSLKKEDSVLVCFGGSDLDVVIRIVSILQSEFPMLEFHWVQADDLSSNLNGNNLHVYKNLDPWKMCQLIDLCRYSIVPSSTILFEVLARKHVPFAGYVVKNQEEIFNGFKNGGYIFPYGDFNNLEAVVNSFHTYLNEKWRTYSYLDVSNIKENYIRLFDELISVSR